MSLSETNIKKYEFIKKKKKIEFLVKKKQIYKHKK
jgi:hypothetical protein